MKKRRGSHGIIFGGKCDRERDKKSLEEKSNGK